MMALGKRLIYITAALCIGMVAQGQIVSSEAKRTDKGGLRTMELLQLPAFRAPAFDQDSARMAMEETSAELRTYAFAHTIETDIDIIGAGFHSAWSDGTQVWRYRVRSAGAKSLGFFFQDFELPQGAHLYIYSTADQKNMIGGFGAENNNSYHSLPVQPIMTDDVVIELQAPKGSRPKLRLTEIYHGVRSIDGLLRFDGPSVGNPSSLLCTPEVACYPEYKEIAKSVVIILTSQGGLGTGSLVNNTSNDGRPLILTASHVFADNFKNAPRDFKALAKNLSERAIYFFNYQTPMCDGSVQPSQQQSVAGSKLIGFHQYTDVALVELSQKPPIDYNPYYAGWSKEVNLNAPHANIHHPRGFTKRINLALSPLTWSTFPGAPSNPPFGTDQHLCVGNWDLGTTQPGSSGSPLLNPQHQIIGVLSGGNSECSNNLSDYFGTLQKVWEASASERQEAEKIIQALDPLQRGGITSCQAMGSSKGSTQAPVRLTHMYIPASNESLLEQLPQLDRSVLLGTTNGVSAVGESYRVPAGSKLYGLYLMLTGNTKATDQLELTVYGDGGAIKLPTQRVELKKMTNPSNNKDEKKAKQSQEVYVKFATPVELTSEELLVFGVNASSIPEEASLVHQQKSDTRENTMMWQVEGKWTPFTQYKGDVGVSLWIDPLISHADLKEPEVEEPRVKLTPLSGSETMLLKLNGKGPHQLKIYTLLGEPIYSDSTSDGADFMILPRNVLEGTGIVILRIEGDGWKESIKAYFPKN